MYLQCELLAHSLFPVISKVLLTCLHLLVHSAASPFLIVSNLKLEKTSTSHLRLRKPQLLIICFIKVQHLSTKAALQSMILIDMTLSWGVSWSYGWSWTWKTREREKKGKVNRSWLLLSYSQSWVLLILVFNRVGVRLHIRLARLMLLYWFQRDIMLGGIQYHPQDLEIRV